MQQFSALQRNKCHLKISLLAATKSLSRSNRMVFECLTKDKSENIDFTAFYNFPQEKQCLEGTKPLVLQTFARI